MTGCDSSSVNKITSHLSLLSSYLNFLVEILVSTDTDLVTTISDNEIINIIYTKHLWYLIVLNVNFSEFLE